MELTHEQKTFLRMHKIPISKVFNAYGMKKSDCQNAMSDLEMSFAYGGTPCLNGHTLRSKAGHCIQCDVKRIAFQMRSSATARVYIAASYDLKLIKVGTSIDIDDRLLKLNDYKYGGANDWVMLASVYVDKAGRVENYIHEKLKEYQVTGCYVREGKTQQCYELFKCNFEDAYKPLKAIARKPILSPYSNLEQTILNCKFRE